jgi:predicted chitinase
MILQLALAGLGLYLLTGKKQKNPVPSEPVKPSEPKNKKIPASFPNQKALIDALLTVVISKYKPKAKDSIPLILDECKKQGVTNKAQIAYILATTNHESAMGFLITEIASGDAYEGRASLGNTQKGDGRKFKGRGFVQLTGRLNYQKFSKILGIDLISNPNLATSFPIAAKILVYGMIHGSYTGKKLSDYINNAKTDFLNARRIVNGTDKADKIKGYADKFYSILKKF